MSSIKAYYEHHALQWLKQGRVLFYQPQDFTGFGNKMRGFLGAFSLSLVTQRFLVTADDLLPLIFDTPFRFSWLLQDYPQLRNLATKAYKLHLPLRPDNWSDQFWNQISHEPLDQVISSPVVWYPESTSLIDAILDNSNYHDLFQKIGLNYANRLESYRNLATILFAKPYNCLVREKIKLLKENAPLGWQEVFRVGVQFRSFVDVLEIKDAQRESRFLFFLDKFDEVLPFLEQQGSPLQVFVSSDSSRFLERLKTHLHQKKVTVWDSEREIVLTGGIYKKKITLKTKIFKKFESKMDDLYRLLRLRQQKRMYFYRFPRSGFYKRKALGNNLFPILDWLIFKDCHAIISTFTTYVYYAAASASHNVWAYKIDPDTKFHGVLNAP